MKHCKYASIFMIILIMGLHAEGVIVSGHAFLNDQTDHSGIKIKFSASSPSAKTDSGFTDVNGFYTKNLLVGLYNIEFSKLGYISNSLRDILIQNDVTLPDNTLKYGTVVEISDSVAGTLTADNIYKVTGDLIIPTDSSLTISPGVQLLFAGKYNLLCYGTLNAIGTEQDSILFTSGQPSPSPGDWGRVYLNYDDQDTNTFVNRLEYCIFEYGEGQSNWERGGQLDVDHSDIFLANSSFRSSSRADLSVRYSICEIHNVNFEDGHSDYANVTFYDSYGELSHGKISHFNHALRINNRSEISISNIEFANGNNWALYIDDWSTVELDSCYFHNINDDWTVQINNNSLVRFSNSKLIDVHSWNAFGVWSDSYVDIVNNYIEGRIEYNNYNNNSRSQKKSPEIAYNIIKKNSEDCCYNGLRISYNNLLLNIHHNTILGFSNGHCALNIYDNDSLSIHSNIIYSNDYGINSNSNGYLDISYNCFYGNNALTQNNDFPQSFGNVVATNRNGDPADIYSNIFTNPDIADFDTYILRISSPCINAGNVDLFDSDGTISDIGAKSFYFPFIVEHQPMENTDDVAGPYSLDFDISSSKDQSFTSTLYYRSTIDGFFASQENNNSCLFFSGQGSNSHVEIPYTQNISEFKNITIEAWVRPASSDYGYTIFSNRGYNGQESILLYYNASDKRIRWHIDTGYGFQYFDGNTKLMPGKWYHIAAVYDGSQIILYVNGIYDGSMDVSGTIYDTFGNSWIGARRDHGQDWHGSIDEFRIWNIARDQNEILATMSNELTGSENGLAGYWKLNNDSETTVYDYTDNQNNGTLTGCSYSDNTPAIYPVVEYNEADWTAVSYTNNTGTNYTFNVPGRPINSSIDYYLELYDDSDTLTLPYNVPNEFYRYYISYFESIVDMSAISLNDGSIELSWDTPDAVNGTLSNYKLYYDTVPNVAISPTNLLVSFGAGQDRYQHTGLDEGTVYYYRLTGTVDNNTATETVISPEISSISDNQNLLLAKGIIDIEGTSDNSGVKILFTPETISSSLDSTLTDSEGRFSIVLTVGIYSVDIVKEGCVPIHINSVYLGDNYDFGKVPVVSRNIKEISGTISDTLKSDYYYLVKGNITVPQNDTLIIEPGAVIAFDTYCRIDAYGKIFAQGNQGDSIYFKSNSFQATMGDWEYIRLMNNADGSFFNYCVFENGEGYSEWVGSGVLRIEVPNVTIDHCSFRENQRGAVAILHNGVACTIRNSKFHGNLYDQNQDAGIINVRLNTERGEIDISNNDFYQNYGYDINVYECNGLSVADNTFYSNNNYDNSAIRARRVSNLEFTNNSLSGKNYINIEHDCFGIIQNNKIVHSQHYNYGINVRQSCMSIRSNTIHNCRDGIYYENNNNFSVNDRYAHEIVYNIISDSYESGLEIRNNTKKIEVTNNTIIKADKDRNNGPDGAAVYAYGNSANIIYSNNVIAYSRYACYLKDNTGNSKFYNNDFWENQYLFSGDGFPTGLGLLTSQNQNSDPADIYSNIFLDPMFVNYSENNYSLESASPLINAGNMISTDPDGTVLDIGALYYDHGNPHFLTIIDEDNQQLTLQWSAVDRDSLTGYNVYKKRSTETEYIFEKWTLDTVVVISNLINNINYDFVVTATFPNSESIYSINTSGRPGTVVLDISPRYTVENKQSTDPVVISFSLTNNGSKDLHFNLFSKTNEYKNIDNFSYCGSYNDNHYYLSQYNLNWMDAKIACEENGGHLVTIADPAENDFISTARNNIYRTNVTIGYTDQEIEGTWRWVTGESSSYTNWSDGQPDNSGDEDYVEMYTDGRWNDTGGGNNRFILEIEPDALNLTLTNGNIGPGESVLIYDTLATSEQYLVYQKIYIETDYLKNPLDSLEVLNINGIIAPLDVTHFTPIAETDDIFYVVVDEADIDGTLLQTGDEIAVFDGETCVGAGGYNGSFPFVFPAYGGASGFSNGDSFTVQIWDSRHLQMATCHYSVNSGCQTFQSGGFTRLDINGTIYKTLQIPLTAGRFNLISSYLFPRNTRIDSVFHGLAGLKILYQDNGNAYIPQYNLNSIGDMDIAEAYHVFIDGSDQILNINGIGIFPENWQILLKAKQFNSIATLYNASIDVTTAFQSIIDQIDIIQDDEGGVWIPAMGINSLMTLNPGDGYQIFIKGDTDIEFYYPSVDQVTIAKGTIAEKTDIKPEHFQFVKTGVPYTVIVQSANFDQHPFENGDEIGIYAHGLCVGAGVWQKDQALVIPTWKSFKDQKLPGYNPGEQIKIRGYSRRFRTEFEMDAQFANESQKEFEGASYSVINASGSPELIPQKYALKQNYPNPFNPSTMIPFDIPNESDVTIIIYNMLGEEIYRVANNQNYLPGHYQILWNGCSDNGRQLASGIYFVRMVADDYQAIKKMILLK